MVKNQLIEVCRDIIGAVDIPGSKIETLTHCNCAVITTGTSLTVTQLRKLVTFSQVRAIVVENGTLTISVE